MQVDSLNTAKNNFNFGSTFEDFFNLDYNANSSSSSSSSQQQRPRSRSSSPADSFSHLPPTPQQQMINDPSTSTSSSSNPYSNYGYNFVNNSNNNLSSPLSFPIPMDPDSLFNFLPEDDQFMLKTGLAPDPLSSTTSSSSVESSPYDFFGPLNDFSVNLTSNSNWRRAAGNNSNNSLYTGDVAMTAGAGAYVPFAIDPQLVGTPASSAASPSTGRIGFNGNNGNSAPSEADDEESNSNSTSPDQVNALPSPQTSFHTEDDEAEMGDALMPLAPVKVGGKGKAARKGTVMSGGVVKKTSAVVNTGAKKKENKDKNRDVDGDDDDKDDIDWRPSPEEYAKMSSKEKRQLRNKISARNFRVRRKEYIHTLEGDIADRDRLIDAIRTELGSTRSENYALRQEIATLKKAVLEGRASPMLPPPAPLSPISPVLSPTFASANVSGSSINNAQNAKSSEPLLTPNMNKDLPSSPRMASASSRGFWGGAAAGAGGFGAGGYTPVHTTLVPDFQLPQSIASSLNSMSAVLAGKNGSNPVPTTRVLQENMNPSLNVPPPSMPVGKYDRHTPPQSPPITRPFANANVKANTTPANGLYNVGLGFAGSNGVLNGSNFNSNMTNESGGAVNSVGALGGFGSLSGGALSASSMSNSGFDAFVDMNPFTMKTLDAYRMQLWGRMAALQHQRNSASAGANGGSSSSMSTSTTVNSTSGGETSLTGLASAMRPHYFAPAGVAAGTATSTISGMALGSTGAKLFSFNAAFRAHTYGHAHAHGLPTPPSSPRLASSNANMVSNDEVQARMENSIRNVNSNNNNAMLAATAAATAIASQTILSKLGHAFWDAFSGSSGSSHLMSTSPISSSSGGRNNALPAWDADKVRRVLEGKAVLRVVDVEPGMGTPPASPKIGVVAGASGVGAAAVAGVKVANADGADKLEESMRGLSLGGGEKAGLVEEVKDCFTKGCEKMKMRAAGRCGRGCPTGGFN